MPKNAKRHKIIPASYLILIKSGRILLGRRCNTGFQDGKYGLISGHGEKNETAKNTLRREVKEEIGIDIPLEDMKLVHLMHRKSKHGNGFEERVDFFFNVRSYQGKPRIMEPEKCDDLNWFPLNELPKNTIEYIKRVIGCVKNKVIYSEYGW